MAFSEISENFEQLKTEILSYINTKVEYAQLRVLKKSTKLVSHVLKIVLTSIIFIFFLIFASIGAAILIGNELDNMAYGFFIVAGFYLLLAIFFMIFGRVLFRKQILKSFSFRIIKVKKIKY